MFSNFLVKKTIKDFADTNLPEVRGRYGYLSGIVGIAANTVLFAVKLATGLLINSIALIGDAFNNLTDAASSLVTIIGFKLASKPADQEHPFGHGRLEYVAGLIVSFLIILVGYELLKSSFDRVINPSAVSFTWSALIIIILAIALKLWLFLFNRFLSHKIDSKALRATSFDSLSDAAATSCIALSLIASKFTDFPLDGYVGLAVAGLIIYSGISLTRETISPLLGEVPEKELVEKISCKVRGYDKVVGIHDLIVHSYGPGKYMASLHVELPSNLGIIEMHEYVDQIERETASELGILLTIHMDPLNTDSEEIRRMQEELDKILDEFPQVLSFHDFRIVGQGERENLVFDIVVRNGIKTEEEKKLCRNISSKVQEKHPHYQCVIAVDHNYIALDE